jgi:hypothetical protein
MPIDVHPKRRGRTPEEIAEDQREQAAKLKAAKVATANVPATVTATPPATLETDSRSPVERYIDEICPTGIAGQMMKFTREGQFVIAETKEEISSDRDFVALCAETLIGYIKFSEQEDEPPERRQGLLYQGFVLPPRQSLGDNNPEDWPLGLSGQPEDPWKHQMYLVLQDPQSEALFTFITASVTGRRAVGNLLRHYDRLRRNHPDANPIVRLRPSGFMSKRKGVGWVHTPSFVVMGHTGKTPTAVPKTDAASDMNDQIPY